MEQEKMRNKSDFKSPVGLNRVQLPSTSSGGTHTPTTNSIVLEKRKATANPKGCHNGDWRGFKVSTKVIWNRLNGLALKGS